MITLDPTKIPPHDAYKLLLGAVVPRPIAWVSTVDAEGRPNLAPFSYFNMATAYPPTLLFCPNRRLQDGTKKDTLLNIEATGEFVIHIVSEDLAEAMNTTAAEYPNGYNEFVAAGLEAVPSERVRPPRVAAAAIAFECELFQIVPVGGGEVVIGRIVLAHLREDVYQNGYINLQALAPVARLAGNGYARITDTFDLVRPYYHADADAT